MDKQSLFPKRRGFRMATGDKAIVRNALTLIEGSTTAMTMSEAYRLMLIHHYKVQRIERDRSTYEVPIGEHPTFAQFQYWCRNMGRR